MKALATARARMEQPTTPVDGRAGAGTVTLSTGEEITLPLECEAAVAGATVTAEAAVLTSWLPDGVHPIRVTPERGLLTVVAVAYDRVGDLEPYDEFGIMVPATTSAVGDVPLIGGLAGALTDDLGGYVHYLPVTTESGTALGIDVWGYPKEVADIAISDRFGEPFATVRSDGDTVVSLSVDGDALASVPIDRTLPSYTTKDGRLLRAPVDLRGTLDVGLGGATVSVGDAAHPVVSDLQRADIGRTLGRATSETVEAVIHAGEPTRAGR